MSSVPSFDQAKAITLLLVVGLAGFVAYKLYRTGQAATDTVRGAVGSVGDAISGVWQSIKGTQAEAAAWVAGADKTVGPSGGGSRQELQKLPAPAPEPPPVYDSGDTTYWPFGMGAANTTPGMQGDYYTSERVALGGSPDALDRETAA